MADPPKTARWRCPACGKGLEPASANGSDDVRLSCPGCGGQFRVRRREGPPGEPSTSVFSGEVPAARIDSRPIVGGFGLAWRSLALRAITPLFHLGNTVGGAVQFVLGGFVPVVGHWMREDSRGILASMGGVSVSTPTTDPDSDLGPAIARGDAPELFAEVADVARRLGARPPEQIRLTYLPCCAVMAWGRSRGLVIGLPLLQVLTRAEMRAVLAHEMAHLAGGDATAAARSTRFVQALGLALDADPRPSRSPLRLWARLCRSAADRLHAPIAWGQEARADRASASIAGGDAAASALVKVAAVQPLFREVLDAFSPDDGAANLYAFFRDFWRRLPAPLFTAIRHKLLSDGSTSPDPAHPPLLDRLSAVQAYPPRSLSESDAAPAALMLGDPEAFEVMLHNRLFAIGRVEPSVFHRTRR
jgi:Zn-dependent protease with chaperone function